MLLGEMDSATFNDTTLALSDTLTTLKSLKRITLKLHYCQAKIYFLTHEYDKASQAFKCFKSLKWNPLTTAKKDIAGASERKS